MCLLLFLPAGETTAQTVQTLVSNTGESGANSTGDSPIGVKFTTGSSPATLLEVRVFVVTGNAKTVVRIRDGSTTNPTGTIIATLSNPPTFTNGTLNTFTAPAGITLAANTTYFLSLNDGVTDAANRATFRTTAADGQTGTMGWSIADNSRRILINPDWFASPIPTIPRFEVRGQIITTTGLTATAGDGRVTLSWDDPTNSNISKYQYRQGSGSPLVWESWTDIPNSDATTTSHIVTGLTNGTAYTFQVRAVAGTVNGAPSDEKMATPRANSVPTVANMIPDQTAIVGVTFRYQFSEDTFSDADGDPLSYTAARGDGTNLPTWLTFNANSRTFSGTPQASDIGTLNIRVTASDDNGRSVFDAFDITVNALPVVTIAAGTSPVTEGTAASFTVSASPMPTSNLTVNLSVTEAAGSDFVASGNEGTKTVMIPASGSTTYTVTTVNDDTDEPNGSVTVTVENGTGYTVGSTASATVMVNDDEEEEETLLGAEDAEEAIIFPNPSGDYLEVRSSVEGRFQLLSLSGKPLLEGTTNTRMDITTLQSGLYLVQLSDGRLLKFVRE